MKDIVNSNGVNRSYGVNRSDGVNWSYGVSGSNGVNRSDGVNWSYGVEKCLGVSNAIFLANKKSAFLIFGKTSTEERFNIVMDKICELNEGWFPKFNTAFKLWVGAGKDWKLVDSSKIENNGQSSDEIKANAWKDMPKKTIEYLKSLPEFDADIFYEVTAIRVDNEIDNKKKQLIEKSNELIQKSEELRKQAEEL